GFEATRRIRAAEAEAHKPRTVIVALTAHVIGAAAEAWREAGMDDILHKPFTVAKLAQTIARLLPHLSTAAGGAPAEARAESAPAATAAAARAPADETPLLDPAIVAQLRQMQAMGKGDFVQKVFGLYLEHA